MAIEKQWMDRGCWFGLAVAYALGYTLLNRLSDAYWFMPAGLQLSALLLIPRQRWLALIIGELIAVTYASLHSQHFGWAWVLAHSIPQIALMAIVIARVQRWLPGRESPLVHRLGNLLACMVALAIIKASLALGVFTLVHPPAHYQPPPLGVVWTQYLVYYYLGFLLLVPFTLMLHDIVKQMGSVPLLWRRLAESRFMLESVVLCTGLGMLIMSSQHADTNETQQVLHAALFLPIAAMTLRHGWRGAVVVGLVASVLVSMTTLVPLAHIDTIEAQGSIAAVMSVLLVLGARIDIAKQQEARLLNHHTRTLAEHERKLEYLIPNLARKMRQEVLQAELQMHDYTLLLKQVHEDYVTASQKLVGHVMQHADPNVLVAYLDTCGQALQRLHRLIKNLYPDELHRRDDGLIDVLKQGPLAEAMTELGVGYRVVAGGSPAAYGRLGRGAKISLYRLACAAVAHLMMDDQTDCTQLIVHVRCGHMRGRTWLALRVTGYQRPGDYAAHAMKTHRPHVLLGLAALNTVFEDIASHAGLYGGMARKRADATGQRVGVLLFDVDDNTQPIPAFDPAL